jgi:hypothetical protein
MEVKPEKISELELFCLKPNTSPASTEKDAELD